MATFTKLNSAQPNPQFHNVDDVSPDEVHEKQSELVLIDVREPSEYTGELGHVPGTQLVTLSTLPDHIDELPRDQTIVFICRSGARSANATAFAKEQGFASVYNMHGGMLFWNQLGLEVERS